MTSMTTQQLELGATERDGAPRWTGPTIPATRYQGSKHKLIPWIIGVLGDLQFDSALDAFGGTGAVSYSLRSLGKTMTFNDYLASNAVMAKALIANPGVRLDAADLEFLFTRQNIEYDDIVARVFHDTFFTSAENVWLDQVAQNIPLLDSQWKQAVAYYALFQACLAKRPYNLFHRKNLYMRLASVERSFGNKATWDTPFEFLVSKFAAQANETLLDPKLPPCQVLCRDALELQPGHDLVYVDPPYVSARGSTVDYRDFYHFLDGLLDYRNWEGRIDYRRKHRPITGKRSPWSDTRSIDEAFDAFFRRFRDSTLVVSYRSDGRPSIHELQEILESLKSTVEVLEFGRFQYVLSKTRSSREVLLVAS